MCGARQPLTSTCQAPTLFLGPLSSAFLGHRKTHVTIDDTNFSTGVESMDNFCQSSLITFLLNHMDKYTFEIVQSYSKLDTQDKQEIFMFTITRLVD